MKRLPAMLGVAMLGVFAAPSSADAGKGPVYGELPTSTTGARPDAKAKPKSVPAKETVAGLKSRVESSFDGKGSVLEFESTLKATKASDIGGCLTVGRTKATDWDGPLDAEAIVAPTKGVVPVRSEKLIDSPDGTAKLEITDAWFDSRTRGVRLIGKSTLALKLHSTVPGGMRVFVARDEHAGKKFVQFVVAEQKEFPAYMLAMERNVVTRVGGEAKSQLVGMCSHHRVAIATGGAGESATFEARAILPPLASGEKSSAVAPDMQPLSDFEKNAGMKDVRIRDVRLQFGVSQTSRDKDPIISVSTEWSSEEKIERLLGSAAGTGTAMFGRFRPGLEDEEEPSMRDSPMF